LGRKFNLDVEYIDNISFIGDWKIIFLTIKKVLIRDGINSGTAVTMEPFSGSIGISKSEYSKEWNDERQTSYNWCQWSWKSSC
jgi:hypothetical protein